MKVNHFEPESGTLKNDGLGRAEPRQGLLYSLSESGPGIPSQPKINEAVQV